MRKQRGTILIATGLLLIAAALFLTVYNVVDDWNGKRNAAVVVADLHQEGPDFQAEKLNTSSGLPLFRQYPEMEMPVKEIDGHFYIGMLDFPEQEMTLPVMENWSYPDLKIAPCRFSGSAYMGNLVIAGHNYRSHFSPIKKMTVGDRLTFTDMDGNLFVYEVSSTEILPPTAVEEMKAAGEWELTLFTCTYGGKTRFALRCREVMDIDEDKSCRVPGLGFN